jgi:hypothetical protein
MANENLLIANFYNGEIKGNVSSSAGGVQIPVTVGPQSFIQVTDAAVSGPLPWTVAVHGGGGLSVTKLPAIAAYGAFPPSGTPGPVLGYLTSVIYPPTA